MTIDKQALLDAIAAQGSAGKKAYDDAQAAIASQKQEAIRMALASGVAGQAPQGAQDEISRIVGSGYDSRQAALTSQSAAQQDWFRRLGAMTDPYMTALGHLGDIAYEKFLAESAGGGGGSGGGGGGGGGSDDWYEGIKDKFGTADIAKGAIEQEAFNTLGGVKWNDVGMAPYEFAGAYLEDTYGAPAGTGASWYPQSEDDAAFEGAIPGRLAEVSSLYKKPNKQIKAAKTAISDARTGAKLLPGNQKYITSQINAPLRKVIRKAKKRRK